MSDQPCVVCKRVGFDNEIEPRFGYVTCRDHRHVPPALIHDKTAVLNHLLREARAKVQLGAHYKHKKGGLYRITGHVIDTDTITVKVRYRRVAGPGFDKFAEADIEFARDLDEWTPDRFTEIAG